MGFRCTRNVAKVLVCSLLFALSTVEKTRDPSRYTFGDITQVYFLGDAPWNSHCRNQLNFAAALWHSSHILIKFVCSRNWSRSRKKMAATSQGPRVSFGSKCCFWLLALSRLPTSTPRFCQEFVYIGLNIGLRVTYRTPLKCVLSWHNHGFVNKAARSPVLLFGSLNFSSQSWQILISYTYRWSSLHFVILNSTQLYSFNWGRVRPSFQISSETAGCWRLIGW